MFSLSAGQDHDVAHGRRLLERIGVQQDPLFLVMDRAYEGDETRQLALDLGYTPVVLPQSGGGTLGSMTRRFTSGANRLGFSAAVCPLPLHSRKHRLL